MHNFTMTLATHAITGAALASLIPEHPIAGFAVGFISHFALDTIPHLDYTMHSDSVNPMIGARLKLDKALIRDAVTIGSDAAIGILASIVIFGLTGSVLAAIVGSIGGILPDFLQFVYGHFRHQPLVSLQRFHLWIHTKTLLKEHRAIGVVSQLIFVAFVIAMAKLYLCTRSLT